ncbi:MAG: hypothetical protein IJI57_14135 [Flexilinea sp.]|nr:hypothetical protein [Flexilinea sp.]
MKKCLIPVLLLLALVCITGTVFAQTPEPTQTPYIIYVVVTATPTPEEEMIQKVTEAPVAEDVTIVRPTAVEPIALINDGADTVSGGEEITITNSYAKTTDELVERVVATVMASANTMAGGSGTAQDYSGNGGAIVHLNDGSTCTMNFQLVSEPTYPAGAIIPRGEVFWKEWNIQNIGTCTWDASWEFVFDSGWQIGNTRFHMNRTTAPGQVLNVRLAMVPDQKQDGNYYSTYAFEAPDGTRYGTITSSYTVKSPSYFVKPTEVPWNKKPQHGRPAGPEDWPWGPWPWPYFPWW